MGANPVLGAGGDIALQCDIWGAELDNESLYQDSHYVFISSFKPGQLLSDNIDINGRGRAEILLCQAQFPISDY